MVTTRQIFSGAARTMRAIDREAKRSEARRAAYERAALKQTAFESAAEAAAQYEALIDHLVHPHRVGFSDIDWPTIAAREFVPPPEPSFDAEEEARRKLTEYQPGWFAKTFGGDKKEVRLREAAVENAVASDRARFESLTSRIKDANEEIELARRLIANDQAAIMQVVSSHSKLGELPFCLEAVDLFFDLSGGLVAKVDGLDVEDMPDQAVTLLQSGKLSIKPLTQARIHELHRANVCASALRIGMELLRVIPSPAVTVVMETDLLDAATGHIESTPVLSVLIARQAIRAMALERTEGPAAVERLGAEINWTPKRGFAAIADG